MEHIDATGLACPRPVMEAKRLMDLGHTQFSLSVDNKAATENLSNLAARSGFTSSVQQQGEGLFVVVFERGAAVQDAPVPDSLAGAPVQGQAGFHQPVAAAPYAVFISRNRIGEDSGGLGESLMRMALFTLAQSERPPAVIACMNEGVKLAAGDAGDAEADDESITHLRALVEKGCEVLVCGTCLNHFGLTEHLKAGSVSNMYDIMDRLRSVAQTITL
jgi:selenium metabolism protein YedF